MELPKAFQTSCLLISQHCLSVPPCARLSWLLWVPPWWREHDSYFPGAPAQRTDTYTSIHHNRMNPTACYVSEQHRCERKAIPVCRHWRRGHQESISEETVLELALKKVGISTGKTKGGLLDTTIRAHVHSSHKNDVSSRPVLWLWNQSQYLEELFSLNSGNSGTWSSLEICVQMPISGWMSLSCLFQLQLHPYLRDV